tara:strand:+ start:892 stop:2127 length:1236 start_codon:yes stop_codon:yes gene_type:complete
MFFLYNFFGIVVFIFSPIIFIIRIFLDKEESSRVLEKFCIYKEKNSIETIWLHGVSVGEILSVIPVIKELEKNNKIKKILITSTTKSSAQILSKMNLKKTVHKYFPLDINFITIKFIDFWKPNLAIFVDSEIWPNMYKNLNNRDIPIILLNARITLKSFLKWRRFSEFSKSLFSKISLSLPQNKETFNYLKKLGAKNIRIAGNLKLYGEKKKFNNYKKFKNNFKNRLIWNAVSTHSEEEIYLGKVHKLLKKEKKNILTIIIPRHVNRSNEIISGLDNMGLNTVKHSSKEKIKAKTDIYLVDTYGETEKFYGLSNLSFLGGSLIKHGGQNPLEAARQGNYIIHGKYISNFKEVYEILRKLKISKEIKSVTNMKKIILSKINKKSKLDGKNKIFSLGKDALKKNISEINNFIK